MDQCSKCGRLLGENADAVSSGRDDGLAPLVEVGALFQRGADPKRLCQSCREEAKCCGAAALFGLGG